MISKRKFRPLTKQDRQVVLRGVKRYFEALRELGLEPCAMDLADGTPCPHRAIMLDPRTGYGVCAEHAAAPREVN